MKKEKFFAAEPFEGWPEAKELERYFLGPPKQRWLAQIRNPSASFTLAGLHGTEHMPWYEGRIDVILGLEVHPKWGVFLHWHTRGPIEHEDYFPKGDLNLLREYCYVGQSGPYPVGLFVPMEVGWIAVKDFLEKDGVRSPRIQWVSAHDLPENTFPDPGTE